MRELMRRLRGLVGLPEPSVKYAVSIEYTAGFRMGLHGNAARLASSPEIFSIRARSSGEAMREAVRQWAEKYETTSDHVLRVTARAME